MQTQHNQSNGRDERSVRKRESFVAMADFEYLLSDLRPLLTDAERGELDGLEHRLELARGDEFRWSAVQADIQNFVRKILASVT